MRASPRRLSARVRKQGEHGQQNKTLDAFSTVSKVRVKTDMLRSPRLLQAQGHFLSLFQIRSFPLCSINTVRFPFPCQPHTEKAHAFQYYRSPLLLFFPTNLLYDTRVVHQPSNGSMLLKQTFVRFIHNICLFVELSHQIKFFFDFRNRLPKVCPCFLFSAVTKNEHIC